MTLDLQTRIEVGVLDSATVAAAVLEQYIEFAEHSKLPLAVKLETHLVLDEIVSNVVRHNTDSALACTIVVDLRLDESTLYVDVTDDGVPFDPLSATVIMNRDPSQPQAGGFGLILTRRFTEHLAYARDGDKNRLSFRKRVPYRHLRQLVREAASESRRP
jgi:serine/threonine-protein kinase RsbW